MAANQPAEQVYGLEFQYDGVPLEIRVFNLAWSYQLMRMAAMPFNYKLTPFYDYFPDIYSHEIDLNSDLLRNIETINQSKFYSMAECFNNAFYYKYQFDFFARAQYFYQNPVSTPSHVIDWAKSLCPINDQNNKESIIIQAVEWFEELDQSQYILNQLYQMVNFVTTKIYQVGQQLLVTPNPNLDWNQIQIKTTIQQLQYRVVSTQDMDGFLENSSREQIYKILKCQKLVKFLQNTPRDFVQLYQIDDVSDEQFLAVKNQLSVTLDKSLYNMNKHYLACKTNDDVVLILKLLISGKFQCLDSILPFLRSFIL